MRPLLVFTALLSLAGCSSWQPDAEDIEPVPAERVLAYQQSLENGGEVVVTRDFGLRGGGGRDHAQGQRQCQCQRAAQRGRRGRRSGLDRGSAIHGAFQVGRSSPTRRRAGGRGHTSPKAGAWVFL